MIDGVAGLPASPRCADSAYPCRVYRFLLTPRWLGLAAVTALAALVMWLLGGWQLDRYREKTDRNTRIGEAAAMAPIPVQDVLTVGQVPPGSARYTRVSAVGRYDFTREILVRGRAVDGRVGFEVVTPLLLQDGTALLVNRGWVPPGNGGAAADPAVPPAPSGQVDVVGMVRLPEPARAGPPERIGTHLQVRAIDPARIAPAMPYPLLGGYVTIQQDGLAPIEARYEGTWQNRGYALQWWIFAVMTVAGYAYLAYREAHPTGRRDRLGDPSGTDDGATVAAA